MANNFSEFITKFSQTALDTVFAQESMSRLLEGGKKWVKFEFKNAQTVKIARLTTDGLSNYKRSNNGNTGAGYINYTGGENGDGYHRGGSTFDWEEFTLQWDRGTQFMVDNIDDEEEAGLVVGNLITEFNRTMVVPEIDAMRFSFIASKGNATLGNLVTETPTATNDSTGIIHRFNAAFEYLKNMSVPDGDQLIFVNPSIMTLIRNTPELAKFITQGDYKQGNITFTIEKYMGRPIQVVNSDRFITNAVAGSNGYYASATSKLINFMVVSSRAVVPFVKVKNIKTFNPSVVQNSDSWIVDYRIYHGIFIPQNKVPGIYVSVSTTAGTTVSSLLRVALVAGSVSTQWKFLHGYTNPAGLNGTVVYSANAFTLNATYTVDGSTIVALSDDQVVTESAAITADSKKYFAMLDGSGHCIAISDGEVNLPVLA